MTLRKEQAPDRTRTLWRTLGGRGTT